MVRRRREQRSLFEIVLPDGDKLWPEHLRSIDEALDDEELVETIAAALEKRWANSGTRGRNGTPAEVVLRMLVLKHLYNWSYDELEFQVRANIVYRLFSRVGGERVPDAKTILRIARTLDPGAIESLHRRVVKRAAQRGVSKGRRMRVDTTVVESNVRYPTATAV
jgi:IS5 family transposase